jgi:hypothetical protein
VSPFTTPHAQSKATVPNTVFLPILTVPPYTYESEQPYPRCASGHGISRLWVSRRIVHDAMIDGRIEVLSTHSADR